MMTLVFLGGKNLFQEILFRLPLTVTKSFQGHY